MDKSAVRIIFKEVSHMAFLPVFFLILYLLFSVCDCIWALKRAHLESGRLKLSEVNQKLAAIYTRRFRTLKFCLMPLLLLFYLMSCRFGWPLTGMIRSQDISWLIILALISGWAGDTLLEVSPKLFPAGLGAFLLGHIFYIIAFASPFFSMSAPKKIPLILACALMSVVYVVYMIRELLSIEETKPLRIPFGLYLAALALLFVSASLRLSYRSPLSAGISLLGAALFITSDTLLAFRMFKRSDERGVMPTYTAAQLLLILGVLLG